MQLSAPVVVHVSPAGSDTVYPVIADPPLELGASQDTITCPEPGTTATMVGMPGTEAAVTFDVEEEDGDVPMTLVAVTENV